MEDAVILLSAAQRLYKADKSAANKMMVKAAKAAIVACALAAGGAPANTTTTEAEEGEEEEKQARKESKKRKRGQDPEPEPTVKKGGLSLADLQAQVAAARAVYQQDKSVRANKQKVGMRACVYVCVCVCVWGSWGCGRG
jgi:hypothetical protein